jgi:8-oxo-dGTP diphosphatase
MEELAIKVRPDRFFRVVDYHYPHLTVRLHIYLCRLLEGEPRCIECQDFAWALPKDLPGFHFPDADQSLVTELSLVDPEQLFG